MSAAGSATAGSPRGSQSMMDVDLQASAGAGAMQQPFLRDASDDLRCKRIAGVVQCVVAAVGSVASFWIPIEQLAGASFGALVMVAMTGMFKAGSAKYPYSTRSWTQHAAGIVINAGLSAAAFSLSIKNWGFLLISTGFAGGLTATYSDLVWAKLTHNEERYLQLTTAPRQRG